MESDFDVVYLAFGKELWRGLCFEADETDVLRISGRVKYVELDHQASVAINPQKYGIKPTFPSSQLHGAT
jgi:hypothetical protein